VARRKRRGLPTERPTASTSRPAGKGKASGRRRPLSFRNLLRAIAGLSLLAALGPALFIGTRCYSRSAPAPSVASGASAIPGYVRSESLTYLSLPEWFIVFSADEYAAFIARQPPSRFPYLRSIRQYWGYYSSACAVTKGAYPFDTGSHVMLGVIGASFSVENVLKAAYENILGRLTEWLSSTDTAEDAFARRLAQEYGTFMHTVPWYEFPFASKLRALWSETPLGGPHLLRKLERRVVLTAELGTKAVYGWIIGLASGAAYEGEERRIHARIDNAPAWIFSDTRVRRREQVGQGAYLVTLPRYEEFTRTVLTLTGKGVRFLDIAGNDEILISVIARRGTREQVPHGRVVASAPVLTDPTLLRLALSVPVSSLREVSAHFASERATIEHIYDY
jgi:hypothetical protein